MLRILSSLLVLLWVSSSVASTTAICQEEAGLMQALTQNNEQLADQISSLRALSRGEMVGVQRLTELLGLKEVSSTSLLSRREQFQAEKRERRLTEEPLCEASAKELAQLQQTANRLTGEYLKLMEQFLSLPDENLIQLSLLQRSLLSLNLAHEQFSEALGDSAPALQDTANQAVQALHNQTSKLFAAFLFLEPPSIHTLTPHADVMSLQLELPETTDPTATAAKTIFQDRLYRTRISLTHARTRLHHQVWSSLSLFTLLTPSAISQLPELLLREVRLLVWHVQETLLETRLDIRKSRWAGELSLPVLIALSSIFGILLTVLLVYVAKRVEFLIYWAHGHLVKRVEQRRGLVRLTNLLDSFAPLAPWVLLLGSLSWISAVLTENQWYALLWILPLLRMVILFGLLALILEWLIFKVASTAGSFLNSEQSQALQTGARREALLIVIPWSLAFLIDKILGASLIYRLTELLTLLVAYWRLGALLARRQADYIANTEQALTRELSPALKQRLEGRAFTGLSPLLLPVQLMLFSSNFFDRTFRDFDWYRRLSARWFWLRKRYRMEQQEQDAQPHSLNEDYRQWFKGMAVNGTEFPVIESGLPAAIAKPIDQWMEDRVNENTLMVTGEKGIGKSIALHRLEKMLTEKHQDLRVISQAVPGKITDAAGVRSLIGQLLDTDLSGDCDALADSDAERAPTLLILDECQNLFLGRVGGLEAWRTLLDITNTRVENIFWLFSMNNHSWAYLGNVFGRQYQVRNVIRARRWTQNEIRSLILSRTHLSGYKIRYDDVLLNTYGHQQNAGRSAEQRFFSLLWDSCRGIPLVALSMWLTAIRTQRKDVLVGLPSLPDPARLSPIGDDLLFIYRAIVTHENLTHGELLNVTQQSDNVVRYAIKLGLDIGFLDATDSFRYRITPLWYHTLVNFLARKNMIHE